MENLNKEEKNWSDEIGKNTFESIIKQVEALATTENKEAEQERAIEIIQESVLEVSVRSGWYNPGKTEGLKAEEYLILLGTGGPATRIRGELGEYGEPETARLEVQDWFKPWTEYFPAKEDILLQFARCFYFGE